MVTTHKNRLVFRLLTVIGALAVVSLTACDPIQQSHIDGNVPDDIQLDSVLRRDLSRYFASRAGHRVEVEYSFLRQGPTQSGVAYPKFYLWVVARDSAGSRVVGDGAVRIALIDKAQADVTNFLSRAHLVRDPASADSVFPAPVVVEIRKRL